MSSSELSALYPDHVSRLETEYGRAIEEADFGALVIHSGAENKQNHFDDQYWPLRPTPAFTHWLPLREQNAALILVPGSKPKLVRTVAFDFWHSAHAPEGDHFWDRFEVVEVSDPAQVAEHIPSGRVAFIGEDRARATSWGIDAMNPDALIAALDQIRTIKSEYEVECLRRASVEGARGHQALHDAFHSGDHSELELHLLYLRTTGLDDADTPYKNIVAIDTNAAVLHHVRYARHTPQGPDHSLLVDAGATCMGYASDITRTTVKGNSEDANAFRALIVRLDELQQKVCAAIEPGMPYEDLHDRAHRLLAPILRDSGIATASDDELVDGGVTRAFLPHGLGHSLGVQVHDVGSRGKDPRPDNQYLRTTFEITPGHVFTIEPGCYFIDGLLAPLREGPLASKLDWKLIERLGRFGGIRIEDNIAVQSDGIRNLTRESWPTGA